MLVKFLLVAAVSLASIQGLPSEDTKSSTDLDLNLIVGNADIISTSLFKSLNTFLDTVKPNFDNIVNEMDPEAQKLIRQIVKESRDNLKNEEMRTNYVFSSLKKALKDLEPIKKCSDQMSERAKKWALSLEKKITTVFYDTVDENKREIDDLKKEALKILEQARKVFDDGLASLVKCLTPGKKDSKDCINKKVDSILSNVMDINAELTEMKEKAQETINEILEIGLKKLAPVALPSLFDLKGMLSDLGKCVATLV